MLANPDTKAIAGQVTETALPSNSSIGITLVKTGSSDGKYDNQTYSNVEYKFTDGTSWNIVSGSVLLSATEGTVYGYYPYSDAATNINEVPISATDGKDYMYADPKTGVKNSNASVDLVMNHALSIVKFTIKKATTNGYTGTGSISSVKLEGATLASSGKIDITTGTVTATAGELTYGTAMNLGGSGELFAVPTGSESGIKFFVSMDGQTYTATTTPVMLEKGKQYAYSLNMSSTGLTVNTVTVTAWGEPQDIGTGSGDAELSVDLWATARQTDGVYAIKADGRPVAFAEANDESYAGVAFVANGRVYQVAKQDAIQAENSGNMNLVYWDKNGVSSRIEGLDNLNTLDNEDNLFGLLPHADGTYYEPDEHGFSNWQYAVKLNGDWTVWPTYALNGGALSDFDGAENTKKIIASHTKEGSVQDFTISKAVLDFRNNSTYNEGKSDWFIPGFGELSVMCRMKDDLNTLLSKASGLELANEYWSSTTYNNIAAWYVYFPDGLVSEFGWCYEKQVRLIREI